MELSRGNTRKVFPCRRKGVCKTQREGRECRVQDKGSSLVQQIRPEERTLRPGREMDLDRETENRRFLPRKLGAGEGLFKQV